ncbi:redoxin domain-containing protein [Myxococcota bacterium]|nr:redoxin domain-containing protein [Myxococcota bacterium]
MNWRQVIIASAIALPILALLGLGFTFNPHEVPSVMPGKVAPDCQLRVLDSSSGELKTLKSYQGKPLVVNFWSSWCVPCKTEHGLLQSAARDLAPNVQFIGVVYQDTEKLIRPYLQRHSQAYPQLMDISSKCAIAYGVAGVPETFFIDSEGIIRYKEAGPLSPTTLRRALETVGGLGAK